MDILSILQEGLGPWHALVPHLPYCWCYSHWKVREESTEGSGLQSQNVLSTYPYLSQTSQVPRTDSALDITVSDLSPYNFNNEYSQYSYLSSSSPSIFNHMVVSMTFFQTRVWCIFQYCSGWQQHGRNTVNDSNAQVIFKWTWEVRAWGAEGRKCISARIKVYWGLGVSNLSCSDTWVNDLGIWRLGTESMWCGK